MKILIIGDARHGKGEVSKILCRNFNLKSESSSEAALRLFLFDKLNSKYKFNYKDINQAYEDRINHRDIWYNEIVEYNSKDKSRLAKEILISNDIYDGMRGSDEINKCKDENVFDLYLGVYNPRVGKEDGKSNSINMFDHVDACVVNNGSLSDLEVKVMRMFNGLINPLM